MRGRLGDWTALNYKPSKAETEEFLRNASFTGYQSVPLPFDHQIVCDATTPTSAIRPKDGRDRGAWWPRSNGIRENFAHGSVSS